MSGPPLTLPAATRALSSRRSKCATSASMSYASAGSGAHRRSARRIGIRRRSEMKNPPLRESSPRQCARDAATTSADLPRGAPSRALVSHDDCSPTSSAGGTGAYRQYLLYCIRRAVLGGFFVWVRVKTPITITPCGDGRGMRGAENCHEYDSRSRLAVSRRAAPVEPVTWTRSRHGRRVHVVENAPRRASISITCT